MQEIKCSFRETMFLLAEILSFCKKSSQEIKDILRAGDLLNTWNLPSTNKTSFF